MTVPAKDFSPAPRVDSAILRVHNISRDFFIKNNIEESFFFNIIKTAFGQKRKTLVNNLKNTFDKELINSILEKNNLSKTTRPEEIEIDLWINIIRDLDN
jgi:16S rRNA (adenine1518-N6/adenine1519-N6)-dimethyltransferase